jgi:prepilin-type N-terminal cleavage/methylation domain-containing protein
VASRKQRGDTLVEVTIAMAILASVITATVALGTSAFRLSTSARQRIDATTLMQQEGELIRNSRDHNVLYEGNVGTGWTKFISDILTADPAHPAQYSLCNSGATPVYMIVQPTTSFSNGNTWTTGDASNPNHYPTTNYLTVKNPQQGAYDTWIEVCSPTAASASPEDLRFTIQMRWFDRTNKNTRQQQGNLDTVLTDISNIQQLNIKPGP